jgi:hypothetical protein
MYRYIDLLLYGCFVYQILWYSFCSILCHCIYGCMFCRLLFDFVYYVLLLLCLCILVFMYVPFYVLGSIVLFCVLFLCKCVLYYCHRVSTQLQFTTISISISKTCMRFSCLSYVLHAPLISLFLICSTEKYMVRNEDHKAPHYLDSSTPQLTRPS